MECAEGVLVAERYRLVRKLGAGGMGSVWLVHDLALDSACALKLIDAEKSQSNEVRLRFEREAKAAAQLRGPHVVDVFDHGEWEGVLFIAMEHLEGEDLGARLDRVGALSSAETYRVVAHVSRALTRAHAHGIVHRDLKPENIFLVHSDEGEVAKVLDFGIAKHDAYSLQGKATRTGSFLGTPYYVSPEQARGRSTDHRSDLWSLGIIAFQALTGRPPFESDALGELMGLILYEDLPVPTLVNPALPPALDAWWQRAAARDREDRFQSAKELSDTLGVALGLDKTISVQSMAPRRPASSYADGSGPFPATNGLGSLRGPAVTPSGSAAGNLPAQALADASLEEIGTDAPVSRTRHSGRVLASAFRWSERLKLSFGRLKVQRRRTLVAGAVGGGIALGVILTLALVSSEEQSSTGQPPGAEAPPATDGRRAVLATPGVSLAAPAPPPPDVTPSPQHSIPIESLPTTDESKASGVESASPNPGPKRRNPPPKRRVRPDYGI